MNNGELLFRMKASYVTHHIEVGWSALTFPRLAGWTKGGGGGGGEGRENEKMKRAFLEASN